MVRSLLGRTMLTAFTLPSLTACVAQNLPSRPQPPVLSAWTEWVGDDHAAPDPQPTGHMVIRAITSAPTCPTATADGRALRLTIRETASVSFPVTTCQANAPHGALHLVVAGITLAAHPRSWNALSSSATRAAVSRVH